MRTPAFCICKNEDTDQLDGNRVTDPRVCFRYTDSTIPLLPKSEISSLQPSSVAALPDLCRTWSETPKTGFLTTRLICLSDLNFQLTLVANETTTYALMLYDEMSLPNNIMDGTVSLDIMITCPYY